MPLNFFKEISLFLEKYLTTKKCHKKFVFGMNFLKFFQKNIPNLFTNLEHKKRKLEKRE